MAVFSKVGLFFCHNFLCTPAFITNYKPAQASYRLVYLCVYRYHTYTVDVHVQRAWVTSPAASTESLEWTHRPHWCSDDNAPPLPLYTPPEPPDSSTQNPGTEQLCPNYTRKICKNGHFFISGHNSLGIRTYLLGDLKNIFICASISWLPFGWCWRWFMSGESLLQSCVKSESN